MMDNGSDVEGLGELYGGLVRVFLSVGWSAVESLMRKSCLFACWTLKDASWACRSELRVSSVMSSSFWCIARLDAIILSVLAAKLVCNARSRYEPLIPSNY
jgi:hypothetical protein